MRLVQFTILFNSSYYLSLVGLYQRIWTSVVCTDLTTFGLDTKTSLRLVCTQIRSTEGKGQQP